MSTYSTPRVTSANSTSVWTSTARPTSTGDTARLTSIARVVKRVRSTRRATAKPAGTQAAAASEFSTSAATSLSRRLSAVNPAMSAGHSGGQVSSGSSIQKAMPPPVRIEFDTARYDTASGPTAGWVKRATSRVSSAVTRAATPIAQRGTPGSSAGSSTGSTRVAVSVTRRSPWCQLCRRRRRWSRRPCASGPRCLPSAGSAARGSGTTAGRRRWRAPRRPCR